jgi:riboflavin kinase/FMN adenylyltransferase
MNSSYLRVNDLTELQERIPTYLAIGVFDGVHRGHQHLLQKMVAAGRERGFRPAVLTFFPHPVTVIRDLSGRLYVTSLEERVKLLAEQGIELIIVHPFNETIRHLRAADFVQRLDASLDLRGLWAGHFSLGYQREGDAPFLTHLGKEMGFTVHEMTDLVMVNGERMSSSRIRAALSRGDIADVNLGLGRRFCLTGRVVRNDQLGRTIGFPTANLAIWDQLLIPANGVYATYAWLNQQRYHAATNIGVRPTVDGRRLTVEAHLLDFATDIYGQELRLEFVSRIRDERKFSGVDELKAQIVADVATVRRILAALPLSTA